MQLYVLTLPVIYYYVWEKEYGYIAAAVFTAISLIIRIALAAWIETNNYGRTKRETYTTILIH